MASDLYWFYDVLTVGILIVAAYLGAKRGLMKSVVLVALTILSVLVSWIGAQIAAPIVYDKLVKDALLDSLYANSDSSDPAKITAQVVEEGNYGVEISDDDYHDIANSDSDFFDALAAEIKNNGADDSASDIRDELQNAVSDKMLLSLLGNWNIQPQTLAEILESLQGTAESIGDVASVFVKGNVDQTVSALEENVVAPVIKGFMKIVFFVILLFVLRLVVRPVSELFKGVNKIPVIGPVNSLLGGLLGVAEGLIAVYALALVVRLVVYLTDGSLMFINSETVGKSQLFGLIYNLDLTKFG